MNIQENVATFITKLPKVILLCVIIYLISLNFKAVNEVPKNQEVKAEVSNVVPLDAVKKYFPTCTSVEKVNEVHYVVKVGGEEVGKLLVTTPIADDLIGYAGNVPLFLAVSEEDVILGLTLLDNSESPGFLRRLEKKNLFSAWNGKTLEEAEELSFDIVTGRAEAADVARFDVAGGVAGAVPATASSVASTKKEA